MVTAEQFIEKIRIPLDEGWGYIYGTWGTLWTQAKQDASTREMTVKYGSRWIGHMVTDCSGLLRWALHQLNETIVHHARYQYTDYCLPKGKLIDGKRDDGQPILPGTAVFLQGKETKIHHVGVYVGNDTVVEAKGTIYGVVTSHLNHWDHWGELKMVDYTNAGDLETGEPASTPSTPEDAQAGTVIRAVVSNPNKWLNVRSGAGTQYPVVFQVEKGDIVEVMDAGEPDWWQIRYGGRIGWASAKYLTPIKSETSDPAPEEPPEPDEPEEPDTDVSVSIADIRSDLIIIRDEAVALANKVMDLIDRIDRRDAE